MQKLQEGMVNVTGTGELGFLPKPMCLLPGYFLADFPHLNPGQTHPTESRCQPLGSHTVTKLSHLVKGLCVPLSPPRAELTREGRALQPITRQDAPNPAAILGADRVQGHDPPVVKIQPLYTGVSDLSLGDRVW